MNLENERSNTASSSTSIRNSSVLSKHFRQEYTYIVSYISLVSRDTESGFLSVSLTISHRVRVIVLIIDGHSRCIAISISGACWSLKTTIRSVIAGHFFPYIRPST